MSYFAEIENNVVKNIVVADHEWISAQTGVWVEYFFENPAFIDGIYDVATGVFIPPKPEGDWVWDTDVLRWLPL